MFFLYLSSSSFCLFNLINTHVDDNKAAIKFNGIGATARAVVRRNRFKNARSSSNISDGLLMFEVNGETIFEDNIIESRNSSLLLQITGHPNARILVRNTTV